MLPRRPTHLALWALALFGLALVGLLALRLSATGEPDRSAAQPGSAASAASSAPVAPVQASPGSDSQQPPPSPAPERRAQAAPDEVASPAEARTLVVLVVDQEGHAVAGAQVRASLAGGFEPARVVTTLSNGEGRAQLPLDELLDLHPHELSVARLELRASSGGMRPATHWLEPAKLEDEPIELALSWAARLHGRVLDSNSRPVPGATVEFRTRGRSETIRVNSVIVGSRDGPEMARGRITSDHEGRYEIGIDNPRSPVSVHASHPSHGAGSLVGIGVSAFGDVVLPDLTLRAKGVLAGRVLLADGLPAARVEVVQRMIARADGNGAGATPLAGPSVRTDDEGAFVFANLEPGVHQLMAGDPERLRGDFEDLPNERFATGTRGIELRADCALLSVRVVDPEGTALSGVRVTCMNVSRDEEGHLEAGRKLQVTTRGPVPHASISLKPGSKVLLRVALPNCHRSQLLVELPPTGLRFERELRVHARSELGRLLPEVVDREGAPRSEFELLVFDPYSRLRVGPIWGPAPGKRLEVHLAPGAWLVDVRRPDDREERSQLALGRGQLVQIEARRATRVELRMQ